MAKIVKITTLSGDTVLAVNIQGDFYIDEKGIKHMISKENCSRTRNVPPEVRQAMDNIASICLKRIKLEEKQKKVLEQLKNDKNALDNEVNDAFKALREAQGVISYKEFAEIFYNALPSDIKNKMGRLKYKIGGFPDAYGYDDNHLYIDRTVMMYKQEKRIPYAYIEYDGTWMLYDDAEDMEAYKKDIERYEKPLPVKMPIHSHIWTGDKFSTWYSGIYAIEIKERMTEEYAKELAKKFAKR